MARKKMSKAARSRAAQKAAKTRKANKLKRRAAALKGARARRRPHVRVSVRGKRRTVSVRLNPRKGAKKGAAKKRPSAKRAAAARRAGAVRRSRVAYKHASARSRSDAVVNAIGDVKARLGRVEQRVDAVQRVVQSHSERLRTFGMGHVSKPLASGGKRKGRKIPSYTATIIGPSHQLPAGPRHGEQMSMRFNPFGKKRRKGSKGRRRHHGRRGRR